MSDQTKPYRTVFVGELVQKSGLSTGGRDGALFADAIMARDGAGRFILRGSGLAGALLATLDDLNIKIPGEISSRLPKGKGDEALKYESLWLMHHAHLVRDEIKSLVRPNVAIHAWTGAAAEGLKFDTETLPRGTRWRFIAETDDWRDSQFKADGGAAKLLALALKQWTEGRCWLGRSPARGLGWAQLENLQIFRLNAEAAAHWPDATKDDGDNIKHLISANDLPGASEVTLHALQIKQLPKPRRVWQMYAGTLTVGENDEGYGLDSLSTLGRDFPPNPDGWEDWCTESARQKVDGKEISARIELDAVPAWTWEVVNGKHEIRFMVPGSSIRGAIRSALSAHWRRAGAIVWVPNDLDDVSPDLVNDALLPLFGSLEHDSNLLVSDAYPVDDSPELYVQEQHAEDEFTQGAYASSKFNRPCLVSGKFEFRMALRVACTQDTPGLWGLALETAKSVIETANALGAARLLPLGGGVWRGHGWVGLSLKEATDSQPPIIAGNPQPEAMA